MKTLPGNERPYEKCLLTGPQSLSDVELLAVLLRCGTQGENALELARHILYAQDEEGILSIHHLTMEKLLNIRGIGKVKAIQILCLSELAKRLAKTSAKERLCFQAPESIASYYMEELRHKKQEHTKLLMLNTKSMLLGETDISKGTVDSSIITPRELFIEALQKNATAIVILHNHPSGDPTPSQDDINTTARIKKAGELVGIQLLDHIIIGNNCYSSFRESGVLDML